MKRKAETTPTQKNKKKCQKNNLEWFVSEGIIVPVPEKQNIGFSYILSSPSRMLKEWTFLIGKYREDKQDFVIGRKLDGTLCVVHYPSWTVFDNPTSASYYFVNLTINEDGLSSKSKYGGFQYLRILYPKWKGVSLKQELTLADIHDKVTELKENEPPCKLLIDCSEETDTEDEGYTNSIINDDDLEFENIVKDMECGEPLYLNNETIEMLLEQTDPEKYKSNKRRKR